MPENIIAEWPELPGVVVADGAGIKVSVNSGHLVINDGIAGERRERKFSRVSKDLKRLLILTPSGYVTLDAIRWLSDLNIPWCQLSQIHGIQATSGPDYQDPRLLRSQAMAQQTPTGLAITRYLLSQKLRGQSQNLGTYLQNIASCNHVLKNAERMETTQTISACMSLEGITASRYWQGWRNLPVTVSFSKTDGKKVPGHWLQFTDRFTLAREATQNKSASDPINAMLSYCYAIGLSECIHACHKIGISPILGVMHADRQGRSAFALDLVETIRPICDGIILEILRDRLDRKWFVEMSSGEVRLIPPLTHQIASYSSDLAKALEPHIREIVRILTHYSSVEPDTRRHFNRLRNGVTVTDIIPDRCWEQIRPLLPERLPGRTSALSDRELLSCLAVKYLLNCAWSQTRVGRINHKTALLRLRTWQSAGVWEPVVKILENSGHLDTLILS